jgi:NAD(P)-dependent dehydrogenase (short-subunit alcohol dehydrogenase family)
MLRAGLLEGTVVATAGGAGHVAAACAALGASVVTLEADPTDEDALAAAAATLGPVGTLVCDAATPFVAAGGAIDGLRAGLDQTWNVTRAVTNAIWRPGDGGKLVLLAPRPGDGAHAGALAAALENTARTLSIEWSRYAIRTTAVLPGDATGDDDVAGLIAYLASPAGDYFSGCAFTLGLAAG